MLKTTVFRYKENEGLLSKNNDQANVGLGKKKSGHIETLGWVFFSKGLDGLGLYLMSSWNPGGEMIW